MSNFEKEYIIFSSIPWDYLTQRPQVIAGNLAEKHKVFFVDMLKGIKKVIKEGDFFKKPVKTVAGKIEKINDNLYRYSPPNYGFAFLPTRFDFSTKTAVMDQLHKNLYGFLIKNSLKKLGFNAKYRISLLETPIYHYMRKGVGEDVTIFDCIDEISEIEKDKGNYFQVAEREIIKKADIVVATSDYLKEKCLQVNDTVYKITNGMSRVFLEEIKPVLIPERLRNMKGPIAGYVGSLAEWVDVDIIEHYINRLTDWQFVFTGSVDFVAPDKIEKFDKLMKKRNVYHLGFVDFQQLPAIVDSFDVCLIPFNVESKFVHAINPVKIYEYLSRGKPVVSTHWKEMEIFEDYIEFAEGKEDFADKIRKSYEKNNEELAEKRIDYARQNTWYHRAEKLDQVVDEYLEKSEKG
ncbi:MAG: glycosyltransferase [Vulcanimicrobiota bacterium]